MTALQNTSYPWWFSTVQRKLMTRSWKDTRRGPWDLSLCCLFGVGPWEKCVEILGKHFRIGFEDKIESDIAFSDRLVQEERMLAWACAPDESKDEEEWGKSTIDAGQVHLALLLIPQKWQCSAKWKLGERLFEFLNVYVFRTCTPTKFLEPLSDACILTSTVTKEKEHAMSQ